MISLFALLSLALADTSDPFGVGDVSFGVSDPQKADENTKRVVSKMNELKETNVKSVGVGESAIAIPEDVNQENVKKLMMSLYTAQTAAELNPKLDKKRDRIEWYDFYVKCMHQMGWVTGKYAWERFTQDGSELKISEAIVDIMIGTLGAAATGGASVAATALLTLNHIKKASEKGELQVFRNDSEQWDKLEFTVGTAAQDTHGLISVSTTAFSLHDEKKQHKGFFGWWNYATSDFKIEYSGVNMQLNPWIYDKSQDLIDALFKKGQEEANIMHKISSSSDVKKANEESKPDDSPLGSILLTLHESHERKSTTTEIGVATVGNEKKLGAGFEHRSGKELWNAARSCVRRHLNGKDEKHEDRVTDRIVKKGYTPEYVKMVGEFIAFVESSAAVHQNARRLLHDVPSARSPFTDYRDVERPRGMEQKKDGSQCRVYTEAQQDRLGVDAYGREPNSQGPRWTWDPTFEAPAGTKDCGDFTIRVYTEEQQRRLHVDEAGNALARMNVQELISLE